MFKYIKMQYIINIFKKIFSFFSSLFKKSSTIIENNDTPTTIDLNDLIIFENSVDDIYNNFEKSKSYGKIVVNGFDYDTFLIEYKKHETEFIAINQNKKLKIVSDLYFKNKPDCKKAYFVFSGKFIILEIVNEYIDNEKINVFSLDNFDFSSNGMLLSL